jgi:hypothetical protein
MWNITFCDTSVVLEFMEYIAPFMSCHGILFVLLIVYLPMERTFAVSGS